MVLSRSTGTISKYTLSDRDAVPDDQIRLFCDILRFDNGTAEGWQDNDRRTIHVNRIKPLIHKLKWPLARPSTLRKTMLPTPSETCQLCDMHNELNAEFVHQWFKFLTLEVGARLQPLRWGGEKVVGAFAWSVVIEQATRLHRLWLRTDEVQAAFGDSFNNLSHECNVLLADVTRQPDSCEACILARIGSHLDTLWALFTIVKSRITLESHEKHPDRLRLMRLIEPWITLTAGVPPNAALPAEHPHPVRYKLCLGMAEELYEHREELRLDEHRQKRAQRKLLETDYSSSAKYKQMVKDLETNAAEATIHDAENDVIDAYAALRNTQRASALLSCSLGAPGGPPNARSRSRQHAQGTPAAPAHQPNPYMLQPPGQGIIDNESRYSVDTTQNNNRVMRSRLTAYANLEGRIPAATEYSVAPNPFTVAESHASTATVWPVFNNGSAVDLRKPSTKHRTSGKSRRRRSDLPQISETARGNRTNPRERRRPSSEVYNGDYVPPRSHWQEDSNAKKAGKSKHRMPAASSPLTQMPQAGTLEPDFYYPQDRSRWEDVPVTESAIGTFDSAADHSFVPGNRRRRDSGHGSIHSDVSGYSEYHRQNRKSTRTVRRAESIINSPVSAMSDKNRLRR